MTSSPSKATSPGRAHLKLATLGHVGLTALVLQALMVTGIQTHALLRDVGDTRSAPPTKPLPVPPSKLQLAPPTETSPQSLRHADWLNLTLTTPSDSRQVNLHTAGDVVGDEAGFISQTHKTLVQGGRLPSSNKDVNFHPKSLYFRSRDGVESLAYSVNSRHNPEQSLFSSHSDNTSWLGYIKTLMYRAVSKVFQAFTPATHEDVTSTYGHPDKNVEHVAEDRTLDKRGEIIVHNKSRYSKHSRRSRRKRAASSTSKFTGLVVGATENKKLQSSVSRFLKDVEKSIWQQQSNVTRAFSKDHPASVLGAYNSKVFTNFRGIPKEAELRHDPEYQLPDVNALTQLLVLNCLTEAGIYGSAQNPDVGEVLDMLSAIDTFHLKDRNGGSILITMWPEQLWEGSGGWRSYPENLLLTSVKGRNVRGQLQNQVTSCDSCQTSRNGLNKINGNSVCARYYATPISVLVGSKGTPPDVLNSFANLALGAIFNAKIRREDRTDKQVFATELSRWTNSNVRIDFLIEKLKQMVIVFPAAIPPTTTPQPTSTSTTAATTTTITTTTATTSTTSTTPTTTVSTTPPPTVAATTANPTTTATTPTTTESSTAQTTTEKSLTINNNSTKTPLEASNATSPLVATPTQPEPTNSTLATETPSTTASNPDNGTHSVEMTTKTMLEREITFAEAISRSIMEARNESWNLNKIEALVAALFESIENETLSNELLSGTKRTRRSISNHANETTDRFFSDDNYTAPFNKLNNTTHISEQITTETDATSGAVAITSTPEPAAEQIPAPTSAWPSTSPTPPTQTPTPNWPNQDTTTSVTTSGDSTMDNVSPSQDSNGSTSSDESISVISSTDDPKYENISISQFVTTSSTHPVTQTTPEIVSSTPTSSPTTTTTTTTTTTEVPTQGTTLTSPQPSTSTTSAPVSSPPPPATTASPTSSPPPPTTTASPVSSLSPPTTTASPTSSPPPPTTTASPASSPPPPPTTASPTSSPPVPPTTTAPPKTSHIPAVEPHVNQVLDSVSYFALHEYLDHVIPSATEDVLLIPSMLSDSPRDFISHDPGNSDTTSGSSGQSGTSGGSGDGSQAADDGDLWHNGQVFDRYNSVDLTSTATAVHALVVSSMVGLLDLPADVEIQRILRSSLRYLSWMMTHPDQLMTSVALSRFPSRFQLYLTLSRITFQLTSMQSRDSDLFTFARPEISDFLEAVHSQMTFAILDSIKDGGLGTDGKTRVYIDDFVGTADQDEKGQPKVSGDDRVFSSALAASSLIFSWTTQEQGGSLRFDKETPDAVRIAVNSLVNFVIGKVLNDGGRHTSIMMSDLVKNCNSLPQRFPYNTVSTLEGKPIDNPSANRNLRFGVKGFIPKEDYEKQLSSSLFGRKPPSPASARMLNGETSYFRIWSSLVYTRAVSLLAVSLAANLQVDGSE